MTNFQAKKAQLKQLTEGTEFTLTDGRLAIFIEVARTKFIYRVDGRKTRGPIEFFHSVGNNSKKAAFENRQKTAERELNVQGGINLVTQAALGDLITLTNGMVVRFFKKNTKRFIGKDVTKGDTYSISFTMAKTLQKIDKDDAFIVEMHKRQAIFNKFKGSEIQTAWGPSIVKKLSDDFDTVTLCEFGTERFVLSFDEFVNELKEHGHL